MNINYGNMHYQWMGLFKVKLSNSPNVTSSNIKGYYKHYTLYENSRVQ